MKMLVLSIGDADLCKLVKAQLERGVDLPRVPPLSRESYWFLNKSNEVLGNRKPILSLLKLQKESVSHVIKVIGTTQAIRTQIDNGVGCEKKKKPRWLDNLTTSTIKKNRECAKK